VFCKEVATECVLQGGGYGILGVLQGGGYGMLSVLQGGGYGMLGVLQGGGYGMCFARRWLRNVRCFARRWLRNVRKSEEMISKKSNRPTSKSTVYRQTINKNEKIRSLLEK
jgi:uncharacterized membrane protein